MSACNLPRLPGCCCCLLLLLPPSFVPRSSMSSFSRDRRWTRAADVGAFMSRHQEQLRPCEIQMGLSATRKRFQTAPTSCGEDPAAKTQKGGLCFSIRGSGCKPAKAEGCQSNRLLKPGSSTSSLVMNKTSMALFDQHGVTTANVTTSRDLLALMKAKYDQLLTSVSAPPAQTENLQYFFLFSNLRRK